MLLTPPKSETAEERNGSSVMYQIGRTREVSHTYIPSPMRIHVFCSQARDIVLFSQTGVHASRKLIHASFIFYLLLNALFLHLWNATCNFPAGARPTGR